VLVTEDAPVCDSASGSSSLSSSRNTGVWAQRRLGKAQSVIARWERGDVLPSMETVRAVVRACGLDLTFQISRDDDSNATIIDQHLRMTAAQRFADLIERVRFHDQLQRRRMKAGRG
jgi:transcriptional regulator with XRE-family HTH domain